MDTFEEKNHNIICLLRGPLFFSIYIIYHEYYLLFCSMATTNYALMGFFNVTSRFWLVIMVTITKWSENEAYDYIATLSSLSLALAVSISRHIKN